MDLKDRFLKYVSFDTRSDDASTSFPSTEKQLVLLRYLKEELETIGLKEVTMDEYGYVMATLPATKGYEKAPVIGFISHVDTAPDMSGENVKLTRPEKYLPDYVVNGIKSALLSFDKKIDGFAVSDAVLTGAETRTSAPIRILRDNDTRLALGYHNLYPAGEGAGYAGGITSAAIDGLKTALALMKIYKPSL